MKNVYIIIGEGFTQEEVKRELKEEGYPYNFYFPRTDDFEERRLHMWVADEIWTFGDVSKIDDYQVAKTDGKDVWVMG